VTELDFATLDREASEEITITEPFLKREMTFRGISMRVFLQRAGVAASARNLSMHALDDYHVSLPIAGLREAGFLATRGDGKKLSVATGGPVRLLFTGDGALARNTDNWIWSFDSARVKR
jgi:DMSO/TMAO reductase YedYZ molybdopterin-dependent catalytic subunit